MTSQVTISQVVISQAATSHRLGKVFSGDADRNEGRALRLGWARSLVLQLEQARAECCGQDSLIKLPFGKTSLRKYLISIKETLACPGAFEGVISTIYNLHACSLVYKREEKLE